MNYRQLLLALSLILAGCAQMSPRAFENPNALPAQQAKDRYECERDARSIRADTCQQMEMFESCMFSKGYRMIPGSGNLGLCRRF